MKKTVRYSLLTLLSTAILALGVTGCSEEQAQSSSSSGVTEKETAPTQGTIKIAIAGPRTGSTAEYGDQVVSGAQMAVDHINAKGGVLGRQLEAVVYDRAYLLQLHATGFGYL